MFTTWMHAVAVNSARSTYRRLKNQAIVGGVSDALNDKPDPRTTSVIAGTRLDLLEAMETLERDHPQFVEPLLLRDVYGLPLVVAVNRFPTDTDLEIKTVVDLVAARAHRGRGRRALGAVTGTRFVVQEL